MLVAYLAWEVKTNRIDARWGEGARGEFAVEAELERLHREGYHVFHDWDSGRGNVDHFVVGPTGIFAVETKAYRGEMSAENGKLLRDGRPVYENLPVKQARGNAMKVKRLIADSCGFDAFVHPILCFSQAAVCCYDQVGGVEVVSVGSVNRVIADPRLSRKGVPPEGYSPQQIGAVSRLLERKLGVAPAAGPGSPPIGPTKTKELVDRFFGLPQSSILWLMAGSVFLGSLLFPEPTSKALLGGAYLYHLLGAAVSAVF